MKHPSLEIGSAGEIVSQAMRAIRKKRGLSIADVADAMGMRPRTFEEFESGRGPITHERLFAFADATDSDPFALMLCAIFGGAALAVDSADTKLVMIMVMHLEDFVEREQGDIAFLEPLNIIGGFDWVFRDLSGKLQDRESFLQNWLDQRTGSIGLSALRARVAKRRRDRS